MQVVAHGRNRQSISDAHDEIGAYGKRNEGCYAGDRQSLITAGKSEETDDGTNCIVDAGA